MSTNSPVPATTSLPIPANLEKDDAQDTQSTIEKDGAEQEPPAKYKTCQYCGKVISTFGGRRKYCTPACKQSAYRERKITALFV